MAKTTTALDTPLRQQLDKLAAREPSPLPVLSLYLNLQSDQHGRQQYDAFLRKALPDRGRAFPNGSAERQSFDTDVARIQAHLDGRTDRSARAMAFFASAASDLFEVIELATPLDTHELFVGAVPHLYPLARLNDQFPRYAALLVNTNSARLFVFGLAAPEDTRAVTSDKTKRHSMGGWSQARYQRSVDNFREQHMKEVVDLLDRACREEAIDRIVVSCDEVARPLLFGALPKHLAEKVIDLVHLDVNAPEHQVLTETLDALRLHDATTDAEQVEALLGAWRAGGLGAVGAEGTLRALEMGQVEELMITAAPDTLAGKTESRDELANTLVTKAQQTAARIRFIEDANLLADVGGCGAILRFRLKPEAMGTYK